MAIHFIITKVTADAEIVKTDSETVLFTEIRVKDGSYYVGLKAPTLIGSQTYQLPVADGANNQVLTTNGSGVWSWSNKGGGAGGVTEAFKTIVPVSGTNVVAELAADTLTFFVGSNKMTIVGDQGVDSLTFDVVESNIVHNNLSGYVAARHIDWKAASDNFVTSGSVSSTGAGGLITGSNSNLGKVVIYDGSNHTVTLTVPSIAASYTLKFPTTNGTPDQLLKTDGSGNLGWVTSVATDMFVKVGAGGTADYLNSNYFERDAANHIRIKQNSLLTGVSVEFWKGQALPADPGVDKILFWDESAPNQVRWLTIGGGLTLSGTTLSAAGVSSQVPIGSIVSWIGGYFSNGANAGYTAVTAANNIAAANAYLNPLGWWVCNGAAVNQATSPIWVGGGRYLPLATDDRFLMGDTTIGLLGGKSDNFHTHASGTLVTGNEGSHTHGSGSYANNHTHNTGSYAIGSHFHTVNPPNTQTGTPSTLERYIAGAVQAADQQHTHNVDIAEFNSGSKTPSITGDSGWASNTAVSGTSAVGSAHNHSVSGSTAIPNDTENRPVFLGCMYIVRVKEI